MSIYIILLLIITGINSLYFDKPLSSLWFKETEPSPSLDSTASLNVTELLHLPIEPFEEDILIGIFLGLAVVQLSRLLSKYADWAKRIDEDFALYFTNMSSVELSLMAVLSSLAEEVIFRGWLQNYLGLVLTSIIFGLLHIPPKKEHWPWTISALLMGFVLGVLYDWRGAVTAPFIAHFTINYFNLHALAKQQGKHYTSESL